MRGWGALHREDALEVFDEVVCEPLEPSLLLRRRRIHEVFLEVHAHSRASAADERRKRVVQQPRHDLYRDDGLHLHPHAYDELLTVMRDELEEVWGEATAGAAGTGAAGTGTAGKGTEACDDPFLPPGMR